MDGSDGDMPRPLSESMVRESDRAAARYLLLSQAGVWARLPKRARRTRAAPKAAASPKKKPQQQKKKQQKQQPQQQQQKPQQQQQQQQQGKKSKKQLNREKAAAAQKKAAERKAARAAKQKAKQQNDQAAAKANKGKGGAGGGGGGKWEEPAETPEAHEKVVAALTDAGVDFKLTTHVAVRTSQEAADVRGVPLASGAKAMLLKPKGGSISMLVMSAAVSLDMKKAAKVLGTSKKKLRMASPQDVYEATKCVPGAVPPLGSVFGIPCYVDGSLQAQGATMNFNAGLRTKSISMSVEAYMAVEKPTVASFA